MLSHQDVSRVLRSPIDGPHEHGPSALGRFFERLHPLPELLVDGQQHRFAAAHAIAGFAYAALDIARRRPQASVAPSRTTPYDKRRRRDWTPVPVHVFMMSTAQLRAARN
jgi:hypothetical protein